MNLRDSKEFQWLEGRVAEVSWRPEGLPPPSLTETGTGSVTSFAKVGFNPARDDDPSLALERAAKIAAYEKYGLQVRYAAVTRAEEEQARRVQQSAVRGLAQGLSGLGSWAGRAMSPADYNKFRGENRLENSIPYVHQEYPKALYRKGEKPIMVTNPVDHENRINAGWQERPVKEDE